MTANDWIFIELPTHSLKILNLSDENEASTEKSAAAGDGAAATTNITVSSEALECGGAKDISVWRREGDNNQKNTVTIRMIHTNSKNMILIQRQIKVMGSI